MNSLSNVRLIQCADCSAWRDPAHELICPACPRPEGPRFIWEAALRRAATVRLHPTDG